MDDIKQVIDSIGKLGPDMIREQIAEREAEINSLRVLLRVFNASEKKLNPTKKDVKTA